MNSKLNKTVEQDEQDKKLDIFFSFCWGTLLGLAIGILIK